ncbi:IclR family transcriptional regulator [Bryobacter aggregatus]|uniref:IclR family transcriptional regulator n=1 Tax=Bryobacter aggregatus TaxID=360054 RepID=UPI0004E1C2A7|nr:IclR family transcriptional regulator [Bryobacter aggregatus]
MAAKNHIDLVIKTLHVLESLSSSDFGKPLKQIVEEVGLVKSSVFRILFTLKEAGYVEQPESNGVYRLTLKTAGLSRKNSEKLNFISIARPWLHGLFQELNESVALAERRETAVILVDVIEALHPLRLTFHIGDNCPIHATALGKAVAAFVDEAELKSLLDQAELAPFTPRTKTSRKVLKAELQAVREAGYSVNDGETLSGALLVGAPVFDSLQAVCGAISVNIPTVRCPDGRKEQLVRSVTHAAARISEDLARVGFQRR